VALALTSTALLPVAAEPWVDYSSNGQATGVLHDTGYHQMDVLLEEAAEVYLLISNLTEPDEETFPLELTHTGCPGIAGRREEVVHPGASTPRAWGDPRWQCSRNVLGPVPEVDVMAKRPQGLLNVGTLSARMAVLRSCALDI
jgi:hypothetical protein